MDNATKRPLDIDHDTELTDEHYQLLARAVSFATMGDESDADDLAIDDASDLVGTTRDQLSSYDGSSWREASGRQDFLIDDHPVIHWDNCQAYKGQRRCSLTIVDLGGIRFFYQV